jgi:hypothetical protein
MKPKLWPVSGREVTQHHSEGLHFSSRLPKTRPCMSLHEPELTSIGHPAKSVPTLSAKSAERMGHPHRVVLR